MAGNVSEWVEDNFYFDYEGAPVDGSAWFYTWDDESDYRVRRGGSWTDGADSVRAASRFFESPVRGTVTLGFRLVRSAR